MANYRPSTYLRYVGQKVGRLQIHAYLGPTTDNPKRKLFRCSCDCGRINIEVNAPSAVQSVNPGCGCRRVELITAMGCRKTHGMSNGPEYRSWMSMIQRCQNPKLPTYDLYGGRGISVAAEWRASFQAFYHDMGPRPDLKHTLDRKYVNGNYEPGNCVWSTAETQSNNRRNSVIVTAFGRTMSASQWSRFMGVSYSQLIGYLRRDSGNTIEAFCHKYGISVVGDAVTKTTIFRRQRKLPLGGAERKIWFAMVRRCHNPADASYDRYGGRGIVADPSWIHSFEKFLDDVGFRPSKKHSLERKDVNGPYSPENCIWATSLVQANNTRNNIQVTAFGRTQTAGQWARELNIPYRRLWWNVTTGPGLEALCRRMGIALPEQPR